MKRLLRTTGSGPRRAGRSMGAWLAVAAWIALILTLAGESFSAGSTSRFLGPLLHWLFPDITAERLATAHYLVRKGAHVTEYGVLALLAWRALRLSFHIGWSRIGAGALGCVLAVASLDESLQAYWTARTGSSWDVTLDVAGGAAALTLLVAIRRLKRD